MAGLHFDATYNNADVMRKVRETQKAFAELGNTAEIQGKRIDAAFEKISLKSLERAIEIMKNFPKEVQGISSFQKQIDGLEKHIERVNQRIASVGNGKLGSTLSDVSGNVNIGNVLKEQVYVGSQAINDLTEKIISQRKSVRELTQDIDTLNEAYKKAGKDTDEGKGLFADLTNAKTTLKNERNALFELQTQQAQARLSVRKLRDEQSLYQKEAQDVASANEKMSLSFQKTLAAIGGTAMLKKFVSDVVRVRGQFQQLDVAFTTLLQSKEKANALMGQMVDTAAKTPFNLTELATGAKQLVAYGFASEGVNDTLIRLGNIAAGLGLPLERLTYLYGTTMTQGRLYARDLMQFATSGIPMLQGLADMYGVSTDKVNEMVTAGKIGFPEVQKVIESMTNQGGKFFNLMEEQSKTVTGKISNLGDAWDEMLNKIGQSQEGVINNSIDGLKYLVENYETVGKILTGLVATYGAYKAATIAYYAITKTYGVYDIATKELQFAATMKNIVATKAMTVQQSLLNATISKNPYVLAAVALVSIASAMWAFHDSTTEAEKAQKRFNEKQEESKKIEEEHKQRIDSLVNSSRDIALSDLQRGQSLAELRKEYPKIFAQYDIETIKLADLLKLRRQISEEDTKRAGIKNKIEFSDVESEIKYYENLLKSLSGQQGIDGYVKKLKQLRLDRDAMLQEKGKGISEQFISGLKNIDVNNLNHYIAELERRIKGVGENGKIKLRLPIDAKGSLSEEAIYNTKDIRTLIETTKAVKKTRESAYNSEKKAASEWLSSYKKAYEDAEKAYNDFLKSKKVMSDADRDKELERLKGLRDTAKATYENKGGSASSDNKQERKEESAAEKLRKQQESIREQQDKNAQLEKKQSLDRQRQSQDLQNQSAQAEINAMDEGFEKKQAQRELDNKKEIQALERQKEDYINAVIQAEKEKFDAQEELNAKNIKGYNKKTFDSSTVKVDSSAFDGIINNISKKQLKDKVREQEDSWNEYLIKFGDYQQKRKAIIEKYDKLIKEAEDAGKAATYEKDKQNAVDALDNSIKNSSTLMGQLFADASQKSANEIQKVIEKAELLMQYLESVKDEKGNAQIGGKTVSKKDILGLGVSDNTLNNLTTSTEEVEALRNAINKLKGDLGSKSPFELFKSQIKSAVDKLNQGGKKNIAQGITEIGGAISSFSPAISQFGQDLGNIFGSDDLGNKIAGISDALGGVGQTAAGVGQIMSGDIVGGAMSAVSGISSVVSALDGLFGADYSHYNEMKEQYETISSIWDELISKKTEYLEISTTEERNRAEQEILDMISRKEQTARNLGLELLNSGASAGSHSIGVRIRKDMSDEGWSQWDNFANSIGMIPDDIGGRLEGLFSLSSEQLDKLKGDAPDFWAKLDGDVRTYLEDIIKCGEQTEETTKKTEELWAGMSFDSMVDQFRDALSDMNSSTEDFADDFQQYMINAMIDSFINGEVFQKKLKDWHKKLAEYSESDKKITKDEKNELQKDWDDIVKEGTDYRDSLFESMGFSNSPDSREASKKGFASMSQDSADELNGRFTVIQGHTYEINGSVKAIQSDTAKIAEKLSFLTNMDKNMSDMVRGNDVIISHLSNIEGYTENLVDIRQFMYSMKLGIDTLNTKGITLKR